MLAMLNGVALRRMVIRLETSHDAIHGVLVNEEPDSLFVFVVSTTEVQSVIFLGGCFSDVFSPYFTES